MQQLSIQTDITSPYLAGVAPQLEKLIEYRLQQKELLSQQGVFNKHIQPLFYIVLRILCVLGLLICLLLLAVGSGICNSMALTVLCAFAFVVVLWIFWDRQKLEAWLTARHARLWKTLSVRMARQMLSSATKAAPFVALYDLRGELLIYSRNTSNKTHFLWQRSLKGFYFSAEGFTVFFKNENAPYPYAIMLNAEPESLVTYLADLELSPIKMPELM